MENTVQLSLYRGDDEARILRLTCEKKPLDFTALQIERWDMAIRDEENRLILSLSSQQPTQAGSKLTPMPESGEILIEIAHQDTQQAQWEEAEFDLQITDTQGKIKTLCRGNVILTHDITY